MMAPDGCWDCTGCLEWEELLKAQSAKSPELEWYPEFWDLGENFLQKSGQTRHFTWQDERKGFRIYVVT